MYSLRDTHLIECHWHLSKSVLCLYIGCYVLALLVVGQLPLAIKWRLLTIIVLSVYTIWIGLKYVLFVLPSSFLAIRRGVTNWFIYSQKRGWQVIYLLPTGCLVFAWVIVLQFRVEGSKRYVWLCLPIDGMLTNEHRRLRVYLRYLT